MSEAAIIVNQTKKQYFSPAVFGEVDKPRYALNGAHGNALGLLLLDRYGGEPEIVGSWFGDRIEVLGETRSSGDEKGDEYFRVLEHYEDIGLPLLAVAFEELHHIRDALVRCAIESEPFRKIFRASAERFGKVNMKHALEKHVHPIET